jgi:hypothetical protein
MKKQPDVHLNLNVRGLPLSAGIDIIALCKDLTAQIKQVIKLGLAAFIDPA